MRKLMSANFSRLWKSRAFWALEGIFFGAGVLTYVLVAYNRRNLGQGWLEEEAHVYFYLWVLFAGFAIGIFAAFFLGTEYSDGTLRNKLIAGHSRTALYASCLLTVMAAAVLFWAAWLLAVVLVGLPLSGAAVLTLPQTQAWRLLGLLGMFLGYASLFTMVSMLGGDKTKCMLANLLLAALLLAGGMMAYGKLSAPAFVQIVIPQDDGSHLLRNGLPNPDYLEGNVREAVRWITALLPSGGAMLSLDKNLGFDWRTACCAVGEALALFFLGTGAFGKKDIR